MRRTAGSSLGSDRSRNCLLERGGAALLPDNGYPIPSETDRLQGGSCRDRRPPRLWHLPGELIAFYLAIYDTKPFVALSACRVPTTSAVASRPKLPLSAGTSASAC